MPKMCYVPAQKDILQESQIYCTVCYERWRSHEINRDMPGLSSPAILNFRKRLFIPRYSSSFSCTQEYLVIDWLISCYFCRSTV